MSRHNRSSSNLHECELEPHYQTTPELTHCPKTPRIDHMKTSCQHTLVAHTKEEIYNRKDRATLEDRSLEVADFTHHLRILYRNSFSGFDHQYSAMFLCDVPPRCPWQHEDTNEHSGYPHQHSMPTTVDGLGRTTIRRYTRNRRCKRWTPSKQISPVGDVESSSLGEKPQGKHQLSIYIILF
jgi:hypothetical protein